MIPENIEMTRRSFSLQAPDFESRSVNFSKEEFLQYTVECTEPGNQDTLLEVAAGTCICGRSFAPLVRAVVCLDATSPMLEVGKKEAERLRLQNMLFVKGYAQELPFLDQSFSIVFSRLAFHHFTDVDAAFSEMVRVLKPGGKLVMIDMEAADESLRDTEDHIERLRDPSHVRNLSRAEMQSLFAAHHLSIQKCETTPMKQNLTSWLSLTKTPQKTRQEITARMQAEINGLDQTGFSPYMTDEGICFDQRWLLFVGKKSEN